MRDGGDKKIMKLVYLSYYDPYDIHTWSGIASYMLKAIQSTFQEVKVIGNLKQNNLITFIKGFLYGRIYKQIYTPPCEPSVLKRNSEYLERVLTKIDHEVVFSERTLPIAYLQTEKPIVFWHDANFAGYLKLFRGSENFCSESKRNANKSEQLALSKCRLAIYSSEWAARTAIQYYDVDPDKVKVVPFGANINCNRNIQDIENILKNKKNDCCRLLFISVDWKTKGGDIAVKIAEQLNQRGINCELHIAGCTPLVTSPDFVKIHGFICKASEQGRKQIDDLYSQCHFFILPTRRDASPIVFPEASSFGLPCLASDVGGITTVIHNGKNGFTFPFDARPEDYCDVIENLWYSEEKYKQLALFSFQEYSERLNWETAGWRVHELIQEYCGE
jgi:glycosyltransferase involved in cell wall biosynthesis